MHKEWYGNLEEVTQWHLTEMPSGQYLMQQRLGSRSSHLFRKSTTKQSLMDQNSQNLHCVPQWFVVLKSLSVLLLSFYFCQELCCKYGSRSDSWPVKMGPTAAPETSSENLPSKPCKNPKTKNQYSFHGESLKSRYIILVTHNLKVSLHRQALSHTHLVYVRGMSELKLLVIITKPKLNETSALLSCCFTLHRISP